MPQSSYEFGPFSLNCAEHQLLREGVQLPLTPRMFDLLRVLVENGGHLVEKERLLHEVWCDAFVEEANLTRGISVLRKTLGETTAERYIETVPKRGYRFVGAIRTPTPVAGVIAASGSGRPPVAGGAGVWTLGAAAMFLLGITAYLAGVSGTDSAPLAAPGTSTHRQLTFTGKEVTPTLSPDGTRIAYVSTDSPNRRVIVQDVDGADRIVVFSAPEAGALRWSPDSSEIMFWARGDGLDGVYVASRAGGVARKVAKGWFVSCWSPDGSTIVLALFVQQKLHFVSRLGDDRRTIALQQSRQWIWDLDWSPVHDRLLFVAADEQRRATIWSIRPDGSDQTRIVSTDGEISAARWAPTGDAIYYVNRVNQTSSVFKAMAPGGRTASHLHPGPLVSGLEADGSFGLSADASRLVYARAPYYSNLWLVEAGPGGTTPVRTTQLTRGTAIVERPRVSPDGKTILFNLGYESRANLYTMPATGGTPTQLTFLNAFNAGGVWSPDGSMVAFASTEGGQPRVWVVKGDGRSPRALPTSDLGENFNLAWSPGHRLLYQTAGARNISAVDPDTAERQLLFRAGTPGFPAAPEYSPDGRRVVFWSGRRPRGLWVMDRDGSGETPIYPIEPGSALNPVPIGWSRDGTSIYAFDGKRAAARGLSAPFGETATGARIVKMALDGSPLSTVVDLPFDEVGGVAMFPDGRRFVVSVYSSRSDVWVVENFDRAASASAGGSGPRPPDDRR